MNDEIVYGQGRCPCGFTWPTTLEGIESGRQHVSHCPQRILAQDFCQHAGSYTIPVLCYWCIREEIDEIKNKLAALEPYKPINHDDVIKKFQTIPIPKE